MSVSLVVPFRSDGAERDRNWSWLRARYERLYPDWELVEGTCEGPWSKGLAVNSAVARSSGEIVIVIDADVLLGENVLPAAVATLDTAPWVVPHSTVYRLSDRSTRALMAGQLYADMRHLPRKRLQRRAHHGPPGGGAIVTRRSDFIPVDERFIDWGGEDISLARALDTLVGEHRRLDDFLWHLFHPPAARRSDNRASPENERLAARYLDAAGDPVAMAELCEELPYRGLLGGGAIVSNRQTIIDVPIDERFKGWGQEDRSWGIALGTIAGLPARGDDELIHLHHPPGERISRGRGSPQGSKLQMRYARARGKPEQMKGLIDECRPPA